MYVLLNFAIKYLVKYTINYIPNVSQLLEKFIHDNNWKKCEVGTNTN